MFTEMINLLQQIKARRLHLGFKQSDMPARIGVSRQQYQRLESQGNPRLDTLSLIAKGLNAELMLIPKDKLVQVQAILEGQKSNQITHELNQDLSEDPWKGLLEDDD